MSLVLHFTSQGRLVIWLMRTERSASVQHVGVSPSGQLCIVGNGRPGPISFSLHVESINAELRWSPPFQTGQQGDHVTESYNSRKKQPFYLLYNQMCF